MRDWVVSRGEVKALISQLSTAFTFSKAPTKECKQWPGRLPSSTYSTSSIPKNPDLPESGANSPGAIPSSSSSPETLIDSSQAAIEQEPSLFIIMLTLQAQQDEAHQYYAQARANNTIIQSSLTEVTRKVASLATDMTEFQQRVSDLEDIGMAAGKSLDGYNHAFDSLQLKLEDLENRPRWKYLVIWHTEGERR
ncbi:hypothetical protein NDU88_001823 [Pleurodeles waltl]|uniref:Uncharacterized protein n=1 Tax=Pleurodeles waltl TaxID=8319 RepID=A0AAV7LEC7_PLEWA|nr:hypothetical protein NDU88_001823 [Pleurodeles waltl]